MKRIATPGNFLSNLSQGGSGRKYDIDKDKIAKRLLLSVAKLFRLDYCGVDLMKNEKGNRWFFEI